MHFHERTTPWYYKQQVRLIIVILIVLVAVLAFLKNTEVPTTPTNTNKPVVTLTTPLEYAGEQSLSFIGEASALTEAKITAEKAGSVTNVSVTLGDTVYAGQIIGSISNATERAAVLQAEGVYEAAVAAAAQSDIGLAQAETNLTNAENAATAAFQSAYATVNNTVRNSLDTFFGDPDARTPGLRIAGRGYTEALNAERVAYQTLLPEWQAKANTITAENDLKTELAYARTNVQRTIAFVDTFLTVFSTQKDSSTYSDTELQDLINTYTGLRTTLIGVTSNLDSAKTGLDSANDAVWQASLAATGGTVSSADAGVKQALGTLESARANLAKTVFRSPITGTVNSLHIKTGDFIGTYAAVATIANNDALEIVAYLNNSDRNLLTIGDEVTIESTDTGTVTNIAPAVDTRTGKTEVRITTSSNTIKSGDTVRITKIVENTTTALASIKVPLSAVKFAAENGSVFFVKDDHLVAQPVTLGTVRGGSVVVVDGLTATDSFVKDVRGLHDGAAVDVTN